MGKWALLVLLVLSGCALQPQAQAPVPLESTVPPLEQFMSDAARARQEGSRTTERDTYRKAAQAYPTSKVPWLRLAEGYFEAADYGNAILAAQEVLQRDASDRVATSLLAVSGMRVSTSALAALRDGQDLNADTRRQAEEVVKSLREVLGEPVLVPKPVEPVVATPPRRVQKPRPPQQGTAGTAPAPTPTATPVQTPAPPAAPAPVVAPAPKKSPSPFDALK